VDRLDDVNAEQFQLELTSPIILSRKGVRGEPRQITLRTDIIEDAVIAVFLLLLFLVYVRALRFTAELVAFLVRLLVEA
jgi:hypothetical protein